MKNFIAFMLAVLATIRGFFKKHHEFITIPIAVGIWILSIPFLRWADPTSAVFDSGIFQIPIFGIIQVLIYLAVAWLIMRVVFGRLYRFLINEMKLKFESLQPWQQFVLSYSVFFLVFFALVFLAKSNL